MSSASPRRLPARNVALPRLRGPSETEVTLTYDWSAVPQSIREYIQFPPFGPEHLSNSLHHLAELAAPPPDNPRLAAP